MISPSGQKKKIEKAVKRKKKRGQQNKKRKGKTVHIMRLCVKRGFFKTCYLKLKVRNVRRSLSVWNLSFLRNSFPHTPPKKTVEKQTNLSNICEPLEVRFRRHLLSRIHQLIGQCGCLNRLHNLLQTVRECKLIIKVTCVAG